MGLTKKYFYDYDDYADGDKDGKTLLAEIMEAPELPEISELIIGCWGESWDTGANDIIEGIIQNADKFQQIEHLFMGDMTFEECEVSWIIQGDYSGLWQALPALKALTIKGSSELNLGEIKHSSLESLEIICGGLPADVIESIANAELPNLKKLNLYLGIEDYGWDGSAEDIEKLLKSPVVSKLEYLGLCDSEIQDEIVEIVLKSPVLKHLKTLDFSKGTLSDKGAELILAHQSDLNHLEYLNLEYHFMSDEAMNKLKKLPIQINLDEQNENDEKYGNYPMLTE